MGKAMVVIASGLTFFFIIPRFIIWSGMEYLTCTV